MGSSPKLVCSVKFANDGSQEGVYANAFRIVRDDDHNCYLDFLVYLSDQNEASVVARISVDHKFLPLIRDRLSEAMREAQPGEDPELFEAFVLGMSSSVN